MTVPSVTALAASTAYLLTGCLCLLARRAPKGFWTAMSVILFLLALDRAAGLHDLPANAARQLAREYHVYENRYLLQVCLIFAIWVGGAIGLAAMYLRLRHWPMRQCVAAAGIVLILTYALLRVTSYHPLDDLFELAIAGVQLRVICEFGPLLLIIIPAVLEVPRTATPSSLSD